MKKLFVTLSVLLLLATIWPVSALAEGETPGDPTPTPLTSDAAETPSAETELPASLRIDDENVYEGMDKAYQNGYVPKVKDGLVTLVMPLVADGAVRDDRITATPTLGDTASSPFQYKNYQKTISLALNKVNGGSTSIASYLVRFDLPLAAGRINGVYPVTINIQAQGADGSPIQQSFTCYVTITDGKDPNATTTPKPETPTSQPKIIVSTYSVNPSPIIAGSEFTVKVTLKNTSEKQAVQNMTVTISNDSANLVLLNDSNVIYISKLSKNGTKEIEIRYKTDLETPAQRYNINLAMTYDNTDAMSLSSSGTVTVEVTQQMRVELETPKIANQVNAGDTLPLSFQVMNLGRSAVHNVRVELSAPGLIPSGTAFIGNMEAGTSSAADMDVFIGTKDMTEGYEGKDKYGLTSGVITLIYEDSTGQEYKQDTEFSTSINAPVIRQTSAEPEDEPKKAGQWWISLTIGGTIVAALATFLIMRGKRRVNANEDI